MIAARPPPWRAGTSITRGGHLRYLVTGGAGFIGSNYAHRLLSRGDAVTVFDDLSRPGVRANLQWLVESFPRGPLDVVVGDICDLSALLRAAGDVDVIVHLAGQTALTTSVVHPVADFRANALGTVHVLEAARASRRDPVVIYASTNKVYGRLESVGIVEEATRYAYRDLPFGVPETQALDFHSPYACSKGAGDQYTRDYFRMYGVRTVVLRQSCIYGPRQMGFTDQGWLAWFMLAARTGHPVTVYGDGKQARDVLFVDDLLDAYDGAVDCIDVAAGQVYNVGGGPERVLSVWAEFGPRLAGLAGRSIEAGFGDWRPGDQRVYVSDIRKAKRDLGWTPRVPVDEGLGRLFDWVEANHGVLPVPAGP